MRRMFSIPQLEEIAKSTIENADSLKIFENIVDEDGHKRFIGGDIEAMTITGVSKTYGKWSLSGTHLLIVFVIDVADTTVLNGDIIGKLKDVPDWLYSKIEVLFGTNNVDRKSITFWSSGATTQSVQIGLRKDSTNGLHITIGSITFTSDRTARISFDLLID